MKPGPCRVSVAGSIGYNPPHSTLCHSVARATRFIALYFALTRAVSTHERRYITRWWAVILLPAILWLCKSTLHAINSLTVSLLISKIFIFHRVAQMYTYCTLVTYMYTYILCLFTDMSIPCMWYTCWY